MPFLAYNANNFDVKKETEVKELIANNLKMMPKIMLVSE